uniref:Serine carboxypeptidase 3-like n=1 Tax=Nicotiana sylvestris TaxID=4096 RepID=A0A1U7XDT3_NICSY|nr:PREDICTED: serine carboxypeptidase 3-like [Nicotiana sylvestris]
MAIQDCREVSNLIYVDQPTGTCFSYSSDRHDIRHSEAGVSDDLYDFLQVRGRGRPRHNGEVYPSEGVLPRSSEWNKESTVG